MHIGYILTIIFLALWLGFKIVEKVRAKRAERMKEYVQAQAQDTIKAYSDAENSDMNDLIL